MGYNGLSNTFGISFSQVGAIPHWRTRQRWSRSCDPGTMLGALDSGGVVDDQHAACVCGGVMTRACRGLRLRRLHACWLQGQAGSINLGASAYSPLSATFAGFPPFPIGTEQALSFAGIEMAGIAQDVVLFTGGAGAALAHANRAQAPAAAAAAALVRAAAVAVGACAAPLLEES